MTAKQFVTKINALVDNTRQNSLDQISNKHSERLFQRLKIIPVEHQTSYRDELSSLINNYQMDILEIGMFDFFQRYSVSDNFLFFGKIEMDLLGVKRDTREIVLVDHDKNDFIMLKCASDSEAFIDFLFLYTQVVVNKIIGNKNFSWPSREVVVRLCGGYEYGQFVDFIYDSLPMKD